MKLAKLVSAVVLSTAVVFSLSAEAGSIGRSSSSSSFSRSSSSSFSKSSSSSSSYSKPAPAVAPSKPGGIGGTEGSLGVRKSNVTEPVAAKVDAQRGTSTTSTGTTTSTTTNYYGSPTPTYGSAPTVIHHDSGSSTFMSAFGGSMFGTMLGNSLSRPTTVVAGGGGYVNSAPVQVDSSGAPVAGSASVGQQPMKRSYGFGDFMIDLILFALSAALLTGIIFLFYKGFKMVKNYVNKERGVAPKQPFSPTAQFWKIQEAFAAADVETLNGILGPDLVHEATRDLKEQELTLSNVSHEVVLNTPREFSVHYKFKDGDIAVDQVWHYELHEKAWKLNGIENV